MYQSRNDDKPLILSPYSFGKDYRTTSARLEVCNLYPVEFREQTLAMFHGIPLRTPLLTPCVCRDHMDGGLTQIITQPAPVEELHETRCVGTSINGQRATAAGLGCRGVAGRIPHAGHWVRS